MGIVALLDPLVLAMYTCTAPVVVTPMDGSSIEWKGWAGLGRTRTPVLFRFVRQETGCHAGCTLWWVVCRVNG